MDRKLLGLSLAISAVLASTNIASASERWTNNETIKFWGGQKYENIDITTAQDENEKNGGGIHNTGTIYYLQNNTYTGNKAHYGGGLYNSDIIHNIEKEVYTNNSALGDGGAIYNNETIKNISATFKGNKAADFGGAIYNFGDYDSDENQNETKVSAIIEAINGTFENNTAYSGGAIGNEGKIGSINGSFIGNTAETAYGGAIFNGKNDNVAGTDWNYGEISSIGGTFTKNSAKLGGGAIYNDGAIKEFKDATFDQNTTEANGGALYNNKTIEALTNTTFTKNTASGNGGAIYNEGIIASTGKNTFSENSATKGGAVYNKGKFNISRYASFNNNSANQGGAIYNDKDATVTSSELSNQTFKGNSAKNVGGAIFNDGTMNLGGGSDKDGNSVTFDSNTAVNAGGAIFNNGTLNIRKGVFTNNKSTGTNSAGGAIANNGTLNVESSSFTGNQAYNEVSAEDGTKTISGAGGAIQNVSGTGLTVKNSSFSSNKAGLGGGAIMNSGNATISQTSFKGNTAQIGGAIINGGTKDNQGVLNISESTFEANTAEYGGAVTNDTYGKIEKLSADFSNNSTTKAGGAVYNLGSIKTIGGSFTANKASGEDTSGGAIANVGTIEEINSNFESNSSDGIGGAIVNTGIINSISGKFKNNTAKTGGGAIVTFDVTSEGNTSTANLKEIKNSEFTGNSATGKDSAGGALLANQTVNKLAVNSSKFNSNKADKGGAIGNIGLLDVANSTFTNNSAKEGGAIGNSGTMNISGSSFTGNTAERGGAIANFGTMNINSSTFSSNKSEGEIVIDSEKAGNSVIPNGGAITSKGSLTINNSTFTNNSNNITVKDDDKEAVEIIQSAIGGGALLVSDTATITNSSFAGNSTNYSGGAILTNGSTKLSVNNGAFSNNSAGINGGAISAGADNVAASILAPTANVEIKDTDFANNTAGKYGGAIYYSNGNTNTTDNPTLTINAQKQDVVFTNNKAEKGGDIYLNNSTANLNASSGKQIVFNSGVAGNGTINTTGAIVLNSEITPDGGNLLVNAKDNSTIKASVDEYINGIDLTLGNGATLDLMNGKLGVAKFNNLTSNGGNVKIDMDLSRDDQIADIASVANGSGTLNLKDVNLIADLKDDNENSVSADLSQLNLGNLSIVTNNDLNVLTNDYMYTVKVQDKNLKVDRLNKDGVASKFDGFTFAVNNDGKVNGQDVLLSEDRSFSATKDIEITGAGLDKGWTGEMGGNSLSVKGNGYTLNGADNKGLKIGNAQTLDIEDTNIVGFKTSDDRKGALTVGGKGNLNISAKNSDVRITGVNAGTSATEGINLDNSIYFEGDSDANKSSATLTTSTGRSIIIDDGVRSANVSNEVKMQGNGTILFNGVVDPITLTNENARTIHNNQIKDVKYNLNNGMVAFTKDEYLSGGTNTLNMNGGMLSIANGAVGDIALKDLTLNANSNIAVDADLANSKMDTISVANPVTIANDAKLNVSGINLLSDATKDSTVINFVNDETLKSHITSSVSEVAYSPIYKYGVAYDPTQGSFEFTRGSSTNYNNVNPAVMVAPVAAQLGGYFNQLNAYDQAFSNMDLTMLMTRAQRQALKTYNKYAYDGDGFGSVATSSGAIPEERAGMWARPYTSFEKVNLKNGPKVSNVMFGTFFGGDTAIKELGNGFDGVFSTYIGYNGSHQVFNGNSLWQNGGTFGLTGTLYKGDWFGGWTVATGLSGIDANTMYGSENFGLWSIGTALKTGYNWELLDSKLIIQPHFMASYSLVDTFNYTNGAGLKIHSDAMNAVQLSPGVRFIGNLKDGWQPYVGLDFMWNIMDKTKFTAVETSLPQLSVKPYIQYGIGVQKRWGERSTGYAQAMFRNIGRNGVIFSLGYRAAFGRGK